MHESRSPSGQTTPHVAAHVAASGDLTQPRPAAFDPLQTIIFLLAASVLTLLVGGQRFQVFDQYVHLPQILNRLDPSYLEKDFFVQSHRDAFTVRTYFNALVTPLARVMPLPVIYLGLTWLVNLALVGVTWLSARRLFPDARWAAPLAVALLVANVQPSRLGGEGDVIVANLVPADIGFAAGLAGMWLAMTGRPVLGMVVTLIGMPFHPLMTIEPYMLGWGAGLVAALVALRRFTRQGAGQASGDGPSAAPGSLLPVLMAYGLSLVALGAGAWLIWFSRAGGGEIDARLFFQIAHFRIPHHHLPSHFPASEYWGVLLLYVAMTFAWLRWRMTPANHDTAMPLRLPVALILLGLPGLWLLNYVFGELQPTRLWTIGQTYRLISVAHWFSFLLIAGVAARLIAHPPTRVLGLAAVIGGSAAFAMSAAAAQATAWIREKAIGQPTRAASTPTPGVAGDASVAHEADGRHDRPGLQGLVLCGGLIAFALAMLMPRPDDLLRLLLMFALASVVLSRWRGLQLTGAAVVLAVAGGVAITPMPEQPQTLFARTLVAMQADLNGPPTSFDAAAAWARANTPRDALFVAPPSAAVWRLRAQRSLVVDFRAWPLVESQMPEWFERMNVVYDLPHPNRFPAHQLPPLTQRGGWPALGFMERQYAGIDDQRLLHIARRYGATHALLFRARPTELPIVYEDQRMRIVALPVTE